MIQKVITYKDKIMKCTSDSTTITDRIFGVN